MGDNSVVYLIHAESPYQHGRSKPVQHYIGTAENLDARIAEHQTTNWERLDDSPSQDGADYSGDKPHRGKKTGSGALLLGVFNRFGIGWRVVRTWPGGRKEERHLKRQKHAWRHCPECRKTRRVPSGTHPNRRKNGSPSTR